MFQPEGGAQAVTPQPAVPREDEDEEGIDTFEDEEVYTKSKKEIMLDYYAQKEGQNTTTTTTTVTVTVNTT